MSKNNIELYVCSDIALIHPSLPPFVDPHITVAEDGKLIIEINVDHFMITKLRDEGKSIEGFLKYCGFKDAELIYSGKCLESVEAFPTVESLSSVEMLASLFTEMGMEIEEIDISC